MARKRRIPRVPRRLYTKRDRLIRALIESNFPLFLDMKERVLTDDKIARMVRERFGGTLKETKARVRMQRRKAKLLRKHDWQRIAKILREAEPAERKAVEKYLGMSSGERKSALKQLDKRRFKINEEYSLERTDDARRRQLLMQLSEVIDEMIAIQKADDVVNARQRSFKR